MADVYDVPPPGFSRANKGWLVRPVTSTDKRLAKLESENRDLKELIRRVMERLETE